MSNTTNTSPAATEQATDSHPVAQVEHLDPHTVVIEANIRTQQVVLDDEFLDSIRGNGVITPVSGRRADDGTVYVRYGQRRVLAARETGLASIPVYMNATDTTTAGRITEQLVENDRRAGMTDTERVDAYRALELEGLSVAKIAKATGTRKDTIKDSLTIAASDTARQALTEQESFDMALALAEFDGDEDACNELRRYADEDLPWVMQKLRNNRRYTVAWTAAEAELVSAGITALARNDYDYERLTSLTDTPEGEDERLPIDPETHTGCPGHAVKIDVTFRDDESHTALTPVCTKSARHLSRFGTRTRTGKVDISSLPEDEQETAREQARAERRRLIQNNKDWDAATTVRREWLGTLLGKKTLPKDAAAFIGTTLARHAYNAAAQPSEFAGNLVGLNGIQIGEQLAAYIADHPTKAGHVNLAIVLAARENHTTRESWRTPNPTDTTYLLQLEAWGHHLSPVERLAAGYPEPVDTER